MKEKKEQTRNLQALDDEELCQAFKELEQQKDAQPGGLSDDERQRHQQLTREVRSRDISVEALNKEAYAESMHQAVDGYPAELDGDVHEKETDELTEAYKELHKQTIHSGQAYRIFDAEQLTRFDAIRRELRRRQVSAEELEQQAYQEFMQDD